MFMIHGLSAAFHRTPHHPERAWKQSRPATARCTAVARSTSAVKAPKRLLAARVPDPCLGPLLLFAKGRRVGRLLALGIGDKLRVRRSKLGQRLSIVRQVQGCCGTDKVALPCLSALSPMEDSRNSTRSLVIRCRFSMLRACHAPMSHGLSDAWTASCCAFWPQWESFHSAAREDETSFHPELFL